MHGARDQMHVELQVAMNFIISYLYNKLPRTRVHLYGEELEKLLRLKFKGHWYPLNPMKGSAFRCVHLNSSEIDPSFEAAAVKSGIDFVNDIKSNLPAELSVWVDPGEVSYAIGGTDGKPGPVKVLFKHQSTENDSVEQNETQSFQQPAIQLMPNLNLPDTYMTFNPHAKDFLPKAPDGVFSGDQLTQGQRPRGSSSTFCYSLRPQRKLYTVDEFASTKFGSTKIKSNTRNVAPFQWMQLAGYPNQAIPNNDVFPPAPLGYKTEQQTSPIEQQHHFFQGQQQHRPSSLATSSSFSESSYGSSTSSSPDHIEVQLAKGANRALISPTKPWGDCFSLPPYKPVESWPLEQVSPDIPSPQDDFLNFTGFSYLTPFGVERTPIPTSGGCIMSMAK